MSSLGDLVANLTMNTAGFTAGAKRATKEVDTLATRISGWLQSMGTGLVTSLVNPVTAAVGGIVSSSFALQSMVEAAREAQHTETRLGAVLAATGNAAGFTTAQLKDYASELQRVTNFGDDETVSAMSLLAVHKNINGQVFKDGIRLAQDLAVAMESDLGSAVRLVGKALSDPEQGLSVLRRAGIEFTDAEEHKIKALAESNRLLEAQGVILAKLQGRVGGAAAATAEPIRQLINDLGDLGEAIGTPLLNAMNNSVVGLRNLQAAISQASTAIPDWLKGSLQSAALGATGAAILGGANLAAGTGIFDKPVPPNLAAAAPLMLVDGPELDAKAASTRNLTDSLISLQRQLDELNGVAHASQLGAFADAGASGDQLSQMHDLLTMLDEARAKIEETRQESQRQERADSYFQQLQDDIDVASGAATELDIRLRELERQGFTGEELDQARKQLEELERLKAQKETAPSVSKDDSARSLSSSAAAAVAGSREALSIIARSTNSARDPLLRTAEQQLVEVKKQTRLLDDISDDVRKQVQLEVVSL